MHYANSHRASQLCLGLAKFQAETNKPLQQLIKVIRSG